MKAPAAARHFQPGQFYRLQNFETTAPVLGSRPNGPRMLMEGLALTGAWVDKEKGLLSMIALEMGVSSRQCAYLKPGEPVLVMGPTGAPTEIPHGENVLLAGGGLGNAVLFSIAKALRAQRQQGALLRRATRTAPTCSSAKRSRRPPTRSSGRPTRARRSRPAGRRTRTSAATSSRR